MLRTMIRPEDTVRGPRDHFPDMIADDDTVAASGSNLSSAASSASGASSHEVDSEMIQQTAKKTSDESLSKKGQLPVRQLSQEETIELARRAVENGILEEKRKLASNGAVGDVVRPKLTINLGHSHIAQIPEAVVDIIKDEVER